MKFIVRYRVGEKIKEVEVEFNNCYEIYSNLKRQYYMADLIMIDKFGTEFCLM